MTLSGLEQWYAARCNGDWQHQYGVSIETLDNPGWRIKIDLRDTPKQNVPLDLQKLERTDINWIQCWTERDQFHIACGPLNLSEAIDIFLQWYQAD
jgi:Immunity protein 53